MPIDVPFDSKHFTLQPLAEGVYACIHKPGGAAFSNAGIIDLGGVTLAVDAFNSLAAGNDLRQAAENLFDCPVETLILTHAHNDHWIGTAAFDEDTTLLANQATAQVIQDRGGKLIEDYKKSGQLEEILKKTEKRLMVESDERVRVGLRNAIIRTQTLRAEIPGYQLRCPDHTFEMEVDFFGIERRVELRSFGRGHSDDDAVIFLPEDGIAFIGDIGFFDSQPFMAFCDLELYRKQLHFFLDAGYEVLVPGHGPVGTKTDIALQMKYMDLLEELVGQTIQKGASYEEALQIQLPEPYSKWLLGGMERFKMNIRFMFTHCGGQVPDEK